MKKRADRGRLRDRVPGRSLATVMKEPIFPEVLVRRRKDELGCSPSIWFYTNAVEEHTYVTK